MAESVSSTRISKDAAPSAKARGMIARRIHTKAMSGRFGEVKRTRKDCERGGNEYPPERTVTA